MQKPSRLSRLPTLLLRAVVILVLAASVFSLVCALRPEGNRRPVFGIFFLAVRSDSMRATDFAAGDVIIVKRCDTDALAPGDVIAFESASASSFGLTVTHKIRSIRIAADGTRLFETYGTTTGAVDEEAVGQSRVLGKYVGKIPKLGYFTEFLRRPIGYVLCIFLPCLILIVSEGIRIAAVLLRKRKEEKRAMEEVRKTAAKQARENEEMRAELEALRRLAGADTKNDTEPETLRH